MTNSRIVLAFTLVFALGATMAQAQNVVTTNSPYSMAAVSRSGNHLQKGGKTAAKVTAPATSSAPMTTMMVAPKIGSTVKNVNVVVPIGTVELQLDSCYAPSIVYPGGSDAFVCVWRVRNNTNASASLDVYSGVFGSIGGSSVEFNSGKELLTLSAGAESFFVRSVPLQAVASNITLSFSSCPGGTTRWGPCASSITNGWKCSSTATYPPPVATG